MTSGSLASQESIEFSMAVLCYRTDEDIIPFVENLHRIMSMHGHLEPGPIQAIAQFPNYDLALRRSR